MTNENELLKSASSTVLCRDELKHIMCCNPELGILIWKNPIGRSVKIGQPAGSIDNNGYISISVKSVRYGAHQLVWLYVHDTIVMLDHKDDNPRNNAIHNLQPATYSQNNRKKFAINPHGFKGVRFRSGAFHAHIRINGIITRIGTYQTAKEAGRAYAARAKEINGEFEDQWSRFEEARIVD